MEIAITGGGEITIRFIDSDGRALLEERFTVCGSPKVKGVRVISLQLGTIDGIREVSPVLVRQSNSAQRVTFDGQSPERFTRERCKAIGCAPKLVKEAIAGRVASPGPSVTSQSEQSMADLIVVHR